MKTKQRLSTGVLVKAALLTAVSIVLTRFFSVMLPLGGLPALRVGLGSIPLILSGILFGPLVGGMVGALSDVIGYAINPAGGAFFPGFTLTAALYGILSGVLVKNVKIQRSKWNFNYLNALVMIAFAAGVLMLLVLSDSLLLVDGRWQFGDAMALPILIATVVVTLLFVLLPFFFDSKIKKSEGGISFDKITFIVSLNYVFNSVLLNTFWLSVMFGKGFMVFLPGRIVAALATIPIYSWILYVLARFFKSDID